MTSRSQAAQPGRLATSAALRALSLLVAVLLTASSLSQVAHFVLVQHAFCAEHGELLELSGASARAETPSASGDDQQTQVTPRDASEEHDHCQLLARSQREQLAISPPIVAVAPAQVSAPLAIAAAQASTYDQLQRWLLAPKTSPPSA
jgi:hypothetical protein